MTRFLTKFQKATLDIKPSIVEIPIEEQYYHFIDMKILHLSDLHINTKTSQKELQQLITTINKLNIDFIALTGDIIDTKVSKVQDLVLQLKNIQHPIYFVSGNHDMFFGYEELQKILQLCDINVLDNRYATIEYKGRKFLLAGLSDKFSKYFKITRDEKSLTETIKQKNLFTIFLAHQPKDYTYAIQSKSQLFLCGHTHGGQIYPFHYLVRLVQPFLSGLHFVNNLAVYVNKGLGTWGIRYRFLAPSELPIIKLTKKGYNNL